MNIKEVITEALEIIGKQSCYFCDKLFDIDDLTLIDDEYYCQTCYEDNFFTCDDCGESIYNEDIHHVTDPEALVCENCLDRNYYQCDSCSEYYSSNSIRSDDYNSYCESCFEDNFFTCESCSTIFHTDEMWCDDYGCYCEDCYRENCHSDLIEDYSYKPKPIFKQTNSDVSQQKLYFGIELEIDNGNVNDDVVQQFLDYSDIYVKEDSSLTSNGFEIVSHPCTYLYHKESFNWQDIFSIAEDNNFDSDNSTCGLHIHVNKNYFGESEEIKDKNIINLLYITQNKLWDMIRIFSRRKNTEYSRRLEYYYNPIECLNYGKSTSFRHSVNIKPLNTIEFRFFRGTLDYQTFIATIQLIKMLSEISISLELTDLETITWKDILDYAYYNNYMEFINYCANKGLLE